MVYPVSPDADGAGRVPRHFALVPAAGTGSRAGAPVPKQYLRFGARTMLQWSVDALAAMDWIGRIVVVVAAHDMQAATELAGRPRVQVLAAGGASRRDTVLAGLRALAAEAAEDDWVLVHDAARPGIEAAALERLRFGLAGAPVGGLLALPLRDTVKRARARPRSTPSVDPVGAAAASHGDVHGGAHVDAHQGDEVWETLDRSQLWVAQTPQMFRFGLLSRALAACPDVTDEAAAMEQAGHAPWLIEGARSNFKVTDPEDIELMRLVLDARARPE